LPRFFVAQAGVAFAVGLIAIQTGIFNGFVKSAGLPIDGTTADIWIAAKENLYYELAWPIRYDNLTKARGVGGVQKAEALIVRTTAWRGPEHKIELARVVGFDPAGTLFSPGPIAGDTLGKLRQPDTAVVDESNLKALNIAGVGGYGKVGSRDMRVIGLTRGTQPLVSAAFIYTSLENAKALFSPPMPKPRLLRIPVFAGLVVRTWWKPPPLPRAMQPADDISYVLIQAAPGQDLDALKARLEEALPGTTAYTKTEMSDRTRLYWRQRTGIGFILGLAALVGLVVGMTVVGQILYTSVAEHIKEYGTLRAIGAPGSLFYRIVGEQAILMAVLGYVPGIALSLAVAAWTMTHRGILILITPSSAALLLFVAIAMCVIAAIFAIQRALRVDPAIVFKA
jgi:putative ABC transport system permease protein